jgi:hypothetical protein
MNNMENKLDLTYYVDRLNFDNIRKDFENAKKVQDYVTKNKRLKAIRNGLTDFIAGDGSVKPLSSKGINSNIFDLIENPLSMKIPVLKRRTNPTLEYSSKLKDNYPCWDGYEMIGTKDKDGKQVPNCVPKESSFSYLNYFQNIAKRKNNMLESIAFDFENIDYLNTEGDLDEDITMLKSIFKTSSANISVVVAEQSDIEKLFTNITSNKKNNITKIDTKETSNFKYDIYLITLDKEYKLVYGRSKNYDGNQIYLTKSFEPKFEQLVN